MLDYPTFPISLYIEEVVKLIEDTLKRKNWHKFEMGEISLEYLPFFVFHADAFSEEQVKDDRLVKGITSNFYAMDVTARKLDRNVANDFEKVEGKLENAEDSQYSPTIRKNFLDNQNAVKIAQSHIAKGLGIPRYNIIISGMQTVYVPFWIVYVTVQEGTFKLKINAFSRKLEGEEKVPKRERGFIEITKETLNELKEPNAWLRYTREIVSDAVKPSQKTKIKARRKKNLKIKWEFIFFFLIAIAVIALLLYYFHVI